uniref:Uncharacterized protein n=1 Tax=Anguilla anguilla TaxID=7936 RepID=A0A0E9U5B8_ANGAN
MFDCWYDFLTVKCFICFMPGIIWMLVVQKCPLLNSSVQRTLS